MIRMRKWSAKMIIGRDKKKDALDRLYKSDKFEFVVIYGRRRVGKTALINHFIDDKKAIYFMGVESNEKQNLENFSKSIIEFSCGIQAETSFSSYQAALEYVFKLAEKERVILTIDEYPYVARASKSLASTLQMLIDKYKDNSKLMLILCGSSMSYMEDQVLAYKAPLYGRRTAQMRIMPFDFAECCTYLNGLSDEDKAYVKLTDNGDGTCKVEGTNNDDAAKKVIINASTESGHEAAVEITVKPSKLNAPEYIKTPVITNDEQGSLKVDYSLDLGSREDMSAISWYRCTDAEGSNKVLVAVTRNDSPEYTYKLTAGDVGYYIMAKVESKNIRSDYGTPVNTVYDNAIGVKDVRSKNLSTDFSNFPNIKQSEIKAGFWTVDYNRPADTESFGKWQGADTEEPWVYGVTGNGCVGAGLYQETQGSRLMYTPVEGTYGDMSLKLVVDPAKTTGQGFGSAEQYMDVLLKFDTSTLTGYGLRIIRTKASSNAVTFVLVKYDNGAVTEISDEVIASCYVTGCTISLKTEGNKLTAHVETPTEQLADQATKGYPHVVDLTADIAANSFGGVAIQHTGTTGTGGWQNTTMLHNLDITWEGENNQNP